uniref:Melanocortin-2 receptor accessory protein 2B n=1 Tax=Danio rerio TaxID=7955 RepID=MRP2B_DANRE|nr:melanocortin-2 receptor accessory protein 2B [Danio rerio]P0DM64.1 RecName: Full=Melanocortin-2 receptor accessory protein 2B; Short=zMRAP2b [Danio rerio]|eukprot:XP_005168578.1 melanocortin-2 receptor accessory protein 2B [Danio rerio]
MSEYSNRSQAGADYEWHYEYYEDEEPVSFEGLRANRYSIVIGFWVGLAVFVIFMFFVLTLLTKTGAPHPEMCDASMKPHVLIGCELEVGGSLAFSLPPLPDQSRSLFHFYIHKEERVKTHKDAVIGRGMHCGRGNAERADEDEHFMSSFNIPNFVNSEQSSSLGHDDFLLSEPPIITDGQSDELKTAEPAHLCYDIIRH